MPEAATEIDAGGQTVRVSNPERVLFPKTKRTAPVTKLQVVEYYLAVAPGIMRALRERPTTLERWPKGVHPGMVLATREGKPRRRVLPEAHPARSAALRRDGAHHLPLRPGCRRDLPDRDRRRALGGADGHDHLPPVAGPARRRRPPRRAADRPRPAAGHRLRRRGARRGDGPGTPGRPRLHGLSEDVGRAWRPHLRPDRAALDVHRRPPRGDRVRTRARTAPAGRGDDEVVEGGARQAGVRRLQPERPRPHDRLGLQRPAEAGRDGVGAARLGRARRRSSPRTSPSRRCLPASPRSATGTRRSTTSRTRSSRSSSSTTKQDQGDMPYPPDYPKMPGEPKRVQPSRDRDRPR